MAACMAAALLIAAIFLAARVAIDRSFWRIEVDEARAGAMHVRGALDAHLHGLEVAAISYAALWDETAEHHGFSRAELDALDVDTVWLTGVSGETTWQVAADSASPEGLSLIPPATLTLLEHYFSPPVRPGDAIDRQPGLLRLRDGIMAVVAVPIRGANAPGGQRGTLVFGRHVNGAFLARLGEASGAPVRITMLSESGEPTGTVSHELAEWLSALPAAPDVRVRAGAREKGGGDILLRDLSGRRLAVLSTAAAHPGLEAGRRRLMEIAAALLAGGALLLALLIALLHFSVRTRALAQRRWIEQQRKLERLTHRDSLTGLPNRLHLQRLLPRLLLRASRDHAQLALLYLDLDHFKHVNDSLGHRVGDTLLTAVAQRLRAAMPRHDLLVRMGGDEFVIVATMLPDREAINSLAASIRAALAVPQEVDGVTLSVSPSIGISVYPADGQDLEQLLRHADIALHHAKDTGRGNHQFYAPEMDARLSERLGLERALRQALDHNELSVEYQPCYDLQTLRPVSLEALVRWRGPDGCLIPPSHFIPIAEQSNLIVELGEWVLGRVCQQLAAWQREQVPLIPISVNISVRQFERTALASLAAGLAQELGIDANLLHFEITETSAMSNSQEQLGLLQALRKLGSRILIDDFGTGYSSLSYLKHLPIDTLKIDRAFVRDMAIDENGAAIVRAIVGVAKSLKLMLVAEGIESEEQLRYLRGLGCECGQGFYLSPSMSAERCRALLRQLRGPRPPQESPRLLALSESELESKA
jgi:diguanylate cyclase (GGDEF)-like protein